MKAVRILVDDFDASAENRPSLSEPLPLPELTSGLDAIGTRLRAACSDESDEDFQLAVDIWHAFPLYQKRVLACDPVPSSALNAVYSSFKAAADLLVAVAVRLGLESDAIRIAARQLVRRCGDRQKIDAGFDAVACLTDRRPPAAKSANPTPKRSTKRKAATKREYTERQYQAVRQIVVNGGARMTRDGILTDLRSSENGMRPETLGKILDRLRSEKLYRVPKRGL